MFKGRLSREDFEQILDALFLVDEALINLYEDRLETRVVDDAKVAKSQLQVKSSGLDEYNATQVTLGLDLEILREIVKKADKDEDIIISVDDRLSNLEMEVSGQEYYVSLINPSTLTTAGEWPSVDVDIRATIPTDDFRRSIAAADMFSDEVTFRATEESLAIVASGDNNRTRTVWDTDDLVEYTGGNGEATFALKYLKGIREASEAAENMEIRFGEDWPLHIEFELLEGHGKVEYFIAPRIKNN